MNFSTGTNGTAVIGTDYFPTNALITFNPGDTNEIIQVAITNNLLIEGNRTVTMALTNAVNTVLAAPSNSVLTIVDTSKGPGDISFAGTNFSADASTGWATITVQRTNGTSGAMTVQFTTVPGTALPGVNYATTNGNLSFPDSSGSTTFRVQLYNPAIAQGPVSFGVQLYNVQGGATLVSPTNAIVTITNSNPVIAFTMATNTVAENASPELANIVVQRFNNSSVKSTVNYATTNGTAVAGINYSNTFGTLTFNPGETLKSISVPLINHSNLTAVAFSLNLSSATNAQLVAPSNTVVILNGSAAGISFTTNATTVFKNAGSMLVTVICSNPNVEPVVSNNVPLEVNYTTVDGTARAGINYNAVSGIMVFTNGIGTNTFTVPLFNNQSVSSNLTFSVILTNVTAPGYISPYGTNVVTIAESNAGLHFSQTDYSVFKTAGMATINVFRTGFTDSIVSVNYLATNGTAINGQNFYATNGTLVFTNGVTSQSFNVPLIANNLVQPNLFALLQLSNPTNSVIVQPGAATLTILETGGSYVIPAGSQLVTNYSSAMDETNDIIGSNDTVQVLFAFRDSAGQNVNNLVAYLLANNGVASPSPASQTYGPLTVYGHSVSKPFIFTAQGTNSYNIYPTFTLYDTNSITHIGAFIGTATFTYTLGAWTTTFANTNTIVMTDNTNGSSFGTPASIYPSIIVVNGAGNTLIKATVTLTNISHASLSDVSALVVSPTTNTLIMAHEGGSGQVNHLTLTFDDAATNSLSPNVVPVTSTNKPSQSYPVINFP